MARVVVIVKIECSSDTSGGLDGDAKLHFSLKYPGMVKPVDVNVNGKKGEEASDLGAKFDAALKAADAESQDRGNGGHGHALSTGRNRTTSSHSRQHVGYGKDENGDKDKKEPRTTEYLKIEFDDIESFDADTLGHGKVEIIVIEDSAPPSRPSLVFSRRLKRGWKRATSSLEECAEYRKRQAERKRSQSSDRNGAKLRRDNDADDPWFWFCDPIVSWRGVSAHSFDGRLGQRLQLAEMLVAVEPIPRLPVMELYAWATSVPVIVPFVVHEDPRDQALEIRLRLALAGFATHSHGESGLSVLRSTYPRDARRGSSEVGVIGLRLGAREVGCDHVAPWNFVLGSASTIDRHADRSSTHDAIMLALARPGSALGALWARNRLPEAPARRRAVRMPVAARPEID